MAKLNLLQKKSVSAKAIKQVIVAQSHNKKRNANTKVRNEIHLTGAKAYRQKGTGRARHGAWSAPHMVGGGVSHGPRTHIVSHKINDKLSYAVRKDLLIRHDNANNIIVENLVGINKTKDAIKILEKNNIDICKMRTLVIIRDNLKDMHTILSLRNVRNVKIVSVNNIQANNLINVHKILITSDECAKTLKEIMSK